MKLSALLMSAGTVAMLLLAPAAISDANAASVKFKAQTVKVKVAPPKAISRAAKINVKPMVKVRVRAAKVAPPNPKINQAIKQNVKVAKPRAPKINTATIVPKPKLKPQIAATTHQRNGTIPVNTLLTETARLRTTGSATPKSSVSPETKAAVLKAAVRSKPDMTTGKTESLVTTGQISSGRRLPGAGSTSAPDKPELNVPRGFKDVFRVSGGNLNDALRNADDLEALRGIGAMKDLLGNGLGSNELPVGSGALGRPRTGDGFDGPLMGAAGAPNDGGAANCCSKTVTVQPVQPVRVGGGSDRQLIKSAAGSLMIETSPTPSGGTQTIELFNGRDGSTTLVQTTTSADGEHTNRLTTVWSGVDENGEETVTQVVEVDGAIKEADSVTTEATETGTDQPATDDNATRGGKNAGNWTLFGGQSKPSYTFFDAISQPGTGEQITVRGAAHPNAGPGAVTNGGDGSFVAGGNRGGGGGFGLDPCATVKGPGCGGSGPDLGGPEGAPSTGGQQ